VAVRASPARNDLVRDVLHGIRRRYGKPPVRKDPILLDSLERMIDQLPDTLLGKRDKAILAHAWSGCRRASEVTGLEVRPDGDVDGWCEVDDAGITINLKRSKQNSMSKEIERYGVPARPTAPRYCPVVLLRAWLQAAGHKEGPLFRPVQTQKVTFDRRLHPVSVKAGSRHNPIENLYCAVRPPGE
jgi:integrase